MRKSKFSESQIVGILKDAASGAKPMPKQTRSLQRSWTAS